MTAPLIGLMGHKRVGKDTFAQHLIDSYGYARVAFADPLKDAALVLDPMIAEELWPDGIEGGPRYDVRLAGLLAEVGWERAKEHPEVRRTLQRLGDAVRSLDPDFWVRAAMERVDEERSGVYTNWRGDDYTVTPSPVIVTDVRYPNEHAAIREAGGMLVRITRPGFASQADEHSSEHALDDYPADFEVSNHGDVVTLHETAGAIARYMNDK